MSNVRTNSRDGVFVGTVRKGALIVTGVLGSSRADVNLILTTLRLWFLTPSSLLSLLALLGTVKQATPSVSPCSVTVVLVSPLFP